METPDTCCTFVPYFKIHEGKLNEVKALCEKFVEKTRAEANVIFYAFSFDGDQMHCREAIETRMVCSLTLRMWESSSRKR